MTGSRTLHLNSKGSAKPVDPALTRPLSYIKQADDNDINSARGLNIIRQRLKFDNYIRGGFTGVAGVALAIPVYGELLRQKL